MAIKMRVHDREPIGAALRRFKKLLERSGLKKELRKHEYYEKPCELRRALNCGSNEPSAKVPQPLSLDRCESNLLISLLSL